METPSKSVAGPFQHFWSDPNSAVPYGPDISSLHSEIEKVITKKADRFTKFFWACTLALEVSGDFGEIWKSLCEFGQSPNARSAKLLGIGPMTDVAPVSAFLAVLSLLTPPPLTASIVVQATLAQTFLADTLSLINGDRKHDKVNDSPKTESKDGTPTTVTKPVSVPAISQATASAGFNSKERTDPASASSAPPLTLAPSLTHTSPPLGQYLDTIDIKKVLAAVTTAATSPKRLPAYSRRNFSAKPDVTLPTTCLGGDHLDEARYTLWDQVATVLNGMNFHFKFNASSLNSTTTNTLPPLLTQLADVPTGSQIVAAIKAAFHAAIGFGWTPRYFAGNLACHLPIWLQDASIPVFGSITDEDGYLWCEAIMNFVGRAYGSDSFIPTLESLAISPVPFANLRRWTTVLSTKIRDVPANGHRTP